SHSAPLEDCIPSPFRHLGILLALLGCTGEATRQRTDTSGALLPDTATVDGVLTMRHEADAFARAPHWTIDPSALMLIDGGDDFDLSATRDVVLLTDGRAVALRPFDGAGLMLFD